MWNFISQTNPAAVFYVKWERSNIPDMPNGCLKVEMPALSFRSKSFKPDGINEQPQKDAELKKGRLKVAWERADGEIASYWYRQIKIETGKY